MLATAFSTDLVHETGFFRTLVSIWFAHAKGEWLLERHRRHGVNKARWLNVFHPPTDDQEHRRLLAVINTGIKEGRFFVSNKLRRRLAKRTHSNNPDHRIFVEHAVPIGVLKEMICCKLQLTEAGDLQLSKNVIKQVLERHFTLGWMLRSEKKRARPERSMPRDVDLSCASRLCGHRRCGFTSNKNLRKNYRADKHFSRYYTRPLKAKRATLVSGFGGRSARSGVRCPPLAPPKR